MSTTITIRADESLRAALAEKAAAAGKTVSALVREILEDAVEPRPVGDRAAYLKGRLQLSRERNDAWAVHLRKRNWRS